MVTIDVQDVHTTAVTLWRFRVGEGDWWQIYDDNTTSHDICRMEFNYHDDGHDVWVYDGSISVPKYASYEEKQTAYLNYIGKVLNGKDPYDYS